MEPSFFVVLEFKQEKMNVVSYAIDALKTITNDIVKQSIHKSQAIFARQNMGQNMYLINILLALIFKSIDNQWMNDGKPIDNASAKPIRYICVSCSSDLII